MHVEVDRQDLKNVSSSCLEYSDQQDREMSAVDVSVKDMLRDGWHGQDAMEFGRIWEGVDAGGSQASKFRDNVTAFGAKLQQCEKEYRDAQEDIYNKAAKLPKWII
jgi:uncharacterized protein YukE